MEYTDYIDLGDPRRYLADEPCPHPDVHWNPSHGMFECNGCGEMLDILEIADDDPQIDVELEMANPGCKSFIPERKTMLTEEDIVNRSVNVSPDPIRQAFIHAEEEEADRRERNRSYLILAGLIVVAVLIGFLLHAAH